jgi:hypothetical protein
VFLYGREKVNPQETTGVIGQTRQLEIFLRGIDAIGGSVHGIAISSGHHAATTAILQRVIPVWSLSFCVRTAIPMLRGISPVGAVKNIQTRFALAHTRTVGCLISLVVALRVTPRTVYNDESEDWAATTINEGKPARRRGHSRSDRKAIVVVVVLRLLPLLLATAVVA